MSSPTPRVVCFLDFDNTLFDNDACKADYTAQILALVGPERAVRFWKFYEETRHEAGTVDFPATMDRFRAVVPPNLAEEVWNAIWKYPFASRLFAPSLRVLAHLRDLGAEVAILSDGDAEYQPHKIKQSGVAAAVLGQVRVVIHKQQHLAEMLAWKPADHYIMIDDKAQILADIKRMYPDRFTTIHVRQGHYATATADPTPDLDLPGIGDVLGLDFARLTRSAR
jgi:FMN phosphatase YigB (HAD superfamily)